MIVEVSEERSYIPKELKITFMSDDEFANFKEMIRFCDTVPRAIIKDGAQIDKDHVYDMMQKIYDAMDEMG